MLYSTKTGSGTQEVCKGRGKGRIHFLLAFVIRPFTTYPLADGARGAVVYYDEESGVAQISAFDHAPPAKSRR